MDGQIKQIDFTMTLDIKETIINKHSTHQSFKGFPVTYQMSPVDLESYPRYDSFSLYWQHWKASR